MTDLIQQVKGWIQEDSVIGVDLDSESIKITSLQSKWIQRHADSLRLLNKANRKLASIEKERTQYYLGKMPDEVYKQEPLNLKVLKGDLPLYLNSDEQYAQVKELVDDLTIAINMIELFIKDLQQRSFNIRNAIEYQKFKAGL